MLLTNNPMTDEKIDATAWLSLPRAIVLAAVIIAGGIYAATKPQLLPASNDPVATAATQKPDARPQEPAAGAATQLPVRWGDLGSQLVGAGAIDKNKFKSIYEQRGAFTNEYKTLLLGKSDGNLTITNANAGYLLNLFWALGLANKNPILDSGEMMNRAYGGAGNFASTGGWTLAAGDAMEHYSRHTFFALTSEQQALVDTISRGIYRPCCNNSTHFPDCNHGMAMLGLLELMASQGVSEQDMWKTALTVNSYWFPDQYATMNAYLAGRGISPQSVPPKELVGARYSSGQGYQAILAEMENPQKKPGSSCSA